MREQYVLNQYIHMLLVWNLDFSHMVLWHLIITPLTLILTCLIYLRKKDNNDKLKNQGLRLSNLGIIGSANHGWVYNALFFTTRGIIVARTCSALIQFGFIRPIGESKSMKRASQLASMSLDDILHADKSNFTIPYSVIRSIKVKKIGLVSSPQITIVTDQKNYNYNFGQQTPQKVAEIIKKAWKFYHKMEVSM